MLNPRVRFVIGQKSSFPFPTILTVDNSNQVQPNPKNMFTETCLFEMHNSQPYFAGPLVRRELNA